MIENFYFIFNNIKSSDIENLRILESNHHSVSGRDFELISVPGRNGDLIVDNGKKKNSEIRLLCKLDVRKNKNFTEACMAIEEWLQGEIGYKDLVFPDGYRFKAICVDQINIEKKRRYYGTVEIFFSAYRESDL